MATIYRCDRCRSDGERAHFKISIPVVSSYSIRNYGDLGDIPIKNYDICNSCMITLNEFLKPLPIAVGKI